MSQAQPHVSVTVEADGARLDAGIRNRREKEFAQHFLETVSGGPTAIPGTAAGNIRTPKERALDWLFHGNNNND